MTRLRSCGSVRDMVEVPDSAKVDFSMKLIAKDGVMAARATAEEDFKVTIEWSVRKDR